MSTDFPSAGQQEALEHSPENHAKKVNAYVWNSGSGVWERMSQPGVTPAYKTLVDKTTTTNVVYVGQAASGSATSSALWTITKIDKTTSPIAITHTGGTAVYDNRVGESYS